MTNHNMKPLPTYDCTTAADLMARCSWSLPQTLGIPATAGLFVLRSPIPQEQAMVKWNGYVINPDHVLHVSIESRDSGLFTIKRFYFVELVMTGPETIWGHEYQERKLALADRDNLVAMLEVYKREKANNG